MPFTLMPLDSRITFAKPGHPLDRADHIRDRSDALAEAPSARAVILSEGRIAVALDPRGKRLVRRQPDPGAEERIFLGMDGDAALFAEDVGEIDETARVALLGDSAKFIDLRSISPELSVVEAEMAATARSMLAWHQRHRFCSNCGAPSAAEAGGWRRRCPACGAQHFPRTDPVVIMLVLSGDHVLLGRQRGWPAGMHSLLAGYIEPGETPEAAVRREVMEEAGVPIGRVRYLASQPWPYPSTLMMGFVAEALDTRLSVNETELESARWLSRAEMAEALAERHAEVAPPRKDAIARAMVEAWVHGQVEGV
ncbi:MAG: NAD(+) diphosphatase [Pseudomonadota bacterium]